MKFLDPLIIYRKCSIEQKLLLWCFLFITMAFFELQGNNYVSVIIITYIVASWGKYYSTDIMQQQQQQRELIKPCITDKIKDKVVKFLDKEGNEKTAFVQSSTLEGSNLRVYCKIKDGYRMIIVDNIIEIIE